MNNRVESLDWLRGLMAISIMVYHLWSWLYSEPDTSGLLARLGIYGVSIFFILSGLSMALVYSKYIAGWRTSFFFFLRRLFRIWPLLWICVGLVVIAPGVRVSLVEVVANLTTLFGFVRPDAYINAGAWSIGNEIVYYSLTPAIILLFRKRLIYGNVILLATTVVALYFAFVLLRPGESLASQWKVYINPFNNLFLFVAGVALYFNFESVKIHPSVALLFMAGSVVVLSVYPVFGDQIAIVCGFNRFVFVVASIALVFSFYKFSSYDVIPKSVALALEQFGIATYGVYLLHPLVYLYLRLAIKKIMLLDPALQFGLTMVLTILIALLSYNLFEKRMVRLGKKLTTAPGPLTDR